MNGNKFREKIAIFKESFGISRRLLGILWGFDKKIFTLHAAAICIPAILPFINAYVYKLIIDQIVVGLKVGFSFQAFYVLFAIRLLTMLVQYAASALQSFTTLLILARMPIYLYQLVLSRLNSLDVAYFENPKFRNTLQRVRESYTSVPLNLATNIFDAIQNIIQFALAFFLLSTLNVYFAVGIIIASLPSFFIQIYFSKSVWDVWNENSADRKRFFYLSQLMQDTQGIKETRIFATARKFLTEIGEIQQRTGSKTFTIGRRRLIYTFILNVFSTIFYILIEGSIAFLAITGRITIGSLSYFSSVIHNFESGISDFFSGSAKIFDQSLYVKDIFKVLDMPSKIAISRNAVKIDAAKSIKIEFKNVDFTYPGTKKKVLQNFSCVIKPGEKVAFVGENGAGKTTIIKLLARFYDVTSGTILINGTDIRSIDLESWYRALGVIFQDFIKYEFTLGENIHFGKVYEDYNLSKIHTAASFAGADKIAEKFGRGYNQILGRVFEGGAELSLGQWQKVALARAFLRDAPVLILDEPTASIDAKAEKEIFDKVESIKSGKTVIIISHRFSTVRNADKIYVINHGKITEKGNHEELIVKNGIYKNLFTMQAEKYQIK